MKNKDGKGSKKIKDMLLLEDKKFLFTFSNYIPFYRRSNSLSVELMAKTESEAIRKFKELYPDSSNITVQEVKGSDI